MRSRAAFPFLVLSEAAVNFECWMIGVPEQPLAQAEDILPSWDYERDLEISPIFSLDWAEAATCLRIPSDDLRLRVVVSVGTGIGNLPRRQERLIETVIGPSSPATEFVASIPGRTLSGRLRLSLSVLLEAPLSGGHVLSPAVRGARLWQTHFDVLIEDGGDSRFPVESVSFSKSFHGQPQENAPWYLHWKANDLHADFAGAVRLYVNSDCEEIAARFQHGDGPTLQAMLSDVMSQMAAAVLEHEDGGQALDSCEEGSVGQQIRQWLDVAFPEQDLATIRSMKEHMPGRFRAAILAAADMGAAE